MTFTSRPLSASGTVGIPPGKLVAVQVLPDPGPVTVTVKSDGAQVASVGATGNTIHQINGGAGSVVNRNVSATWSGDADVVLVLEF